MSIPVPWFWPGVHPLVKGGNFVKNAEECCCVPECCTSFDCCFFPTQTVLYFYDQTLSTSGVVDVESKIPLTTLNPVSCGVFEGDQVLTQYALDGGGHLVPVETTDLTIRQTHSGTGEWKIEWINAGTVIRTITYSGGCDGFESDTSTGGPSPIPILRTVENGDVTAP